MDRILPFLTMSAQSRFSALPQLRHSPNFPYTFLAHPVGPGFKSPGFEARRAPDVYRASWRVWLLLVAGHSQSKSAIGTGRARLCAYVKLSTLNSAIDPGIARSEGRGQGQRNKLYLAGTLSLPILQIKGFELFFFLNSDST